jgi:1-acyl-sn-glycerol-3-phosphate acyltransferase
LEARREVRWFPVTPGARRRAQARALQRTNLQLITGFGLDVRTFGPRPEGRVLLVANHLSYIDPIVLATVMPCTVLAKSEVERWPLIGARMRELGVVFVDREDGMSRARALREARRALLDGVSVVNFPEGTTTRGDRLHPFRRGLFGIARSLGVPIVPVRMEFSHPEMCWVGDDDFVSHFLRFVRRTDARVTMRFGKPLRFDPADDAQLIADRAFGVVSRLHLD